MNCPRSCSAPRLCKTVLALVLSAGLWGLPASAARPQEGRRPVDPSSEQIVHALAKGLAQALGSAEVRARLVAELAATPYVEQRIALKRLLEENKAWRRDVLETPRIGSSWKALSPRLPELELYFPAERHRAWKGEPGVRVAVKLVGGNYLSWGTDGKSVRFSASTVPAEPTLLVGPSEIDFDDAESARVGGTRTGEYLERMAIERGLFLRQPETGAGSGGAAKSASTNQDTYLTHFRVAGEFDGSGAQMEVSFWATIDGGYQVCQRFTGIRAHTDYYLPAPTSSGARKIALAVPTGTTTANVTGYEDDDNACGVGGSDTYLGVANLQITQYGTIYGTSNARAAVRIEAGPHCGNNSCELTESEYNCCADCSTAVCGDFVCSPCEDGWSCPNDCPTCGDGICDFGEEDTCFTDCGSQCPPCIICPCSP